MSQLCEFPRPHPKQAWRGMALRTPCRLKGLSHTRRLEPGRVWQPRNEGTASLNHVVSTPPSTHIYYPPAPNHSRLPSLSAIPLEPLINPVLFWSEHQSRLDLRRLASIYVKSNQVEGPWVRLGRQVGLFNLENCKYTQSLVNANSTRAPNKYATTTFRAQVVHSRIIPASSSESDAIVCALRDAALGNKNSTRQLSRNPVTTGYWTGWNKVIRLKLGLTSSSGLRLSVPPLPTGCLGSTPPVRAGRVEQADSVWTCDKKTR
ncbi:unnamed protein product [Protopolystoma xenopodis]|uniref:Uncharacterized protein n=1 Tax=Protopolystoma xenopodis TaxID=117903 RepID=A0A3S5CSL4_9PLAT|nr:unnamed protein product [Protopolystoma xenopodis]